MMRYLACILSIFIMVGLSSKLISEEIVTAPWQIPIIITTSEASDTLYFGTMVGASDGFDHGKDVLAPPPPPAGIYTYFQISGLFNKLHFDFRSNLDSTNSWSLNILETRGASGSISWDASFFPLGDLPGSLMINGTNMLSSQSVSFTGDQNLSISYVASKKYSGVPITIATVPESLTIIVDGTEYSSPHIFDWEARSNHTIGVSSPQSGVIGIRYVYNYWSDNGDTTHAITVPDTATTYVANFTTRFKLTTLVLPSEGGSITLNPDLSWYDNGTSVEITATAAIGYQFSHWSGDVSGIDSTISLVIDAPKKVIANFSNLTEVEKNNDNNLPNDFKLFQNYPNPFNPSTTIKYQIPKSTFVTITIYNNTGQSIEILFSKYQSIGSHILPWNISNLSSGVYYIKMEAENFTDIKKCLILK